MPTTSFLVAGFIVGFCLSCLAVSIACAIWAFRSYSKVVGFENSTHRIEYRSPGWNGDGEDKSLEQRAREAREAFGWIENERDQI